MENVALMLSMLTLLGFATKKHTDPSRLDLKESLCRVSWERAIEQKREGERDRERGPLSH